jgi:hypothetical protein
MSYDLALGPTNDLLFGSNRDLLGVDGYAIYEQRIRTRLKIRRGSWVFDTDKTLGSRLDLLYGRISEQAVGEINTFVNEALDDMEDIAVTNVQVEVAPQTFPEPPPPPNLLPDPSFENGLSIWSPYNGAILNRVPNLAESFKDGLWMAEFQATATHQGMQTQIFPVKGNTLYSFSAYVNADLGLPFKLWEDEFADSVGTVLTKSSSASLTGTNKMDYFTYSFQTNSDTTNIRLYIIGEQAGSAIFDADLVGLFEQADSDVPGVSAPGSNIIIKVGYRLTFGDTEPPFTTPDEDIQEALISFQL